MTAILGITDSHCATAALLVDGRIVACVSEERFTRRKNEGGYPRQSVDYCLGFLPDGGAGTREPRSILADPRDVRVVARLNKMIKSRDFWMPFAPTVLAERALDYLKNPKGLQSPFMMLAFDTTPEGRECLPAAIHPYDATARPQILRETDHPAYHRLVRRFEERTGVGGVLNTSFNLHGEPIVCSPAEAVETFEKSGLPHLFLGEFLVSKRNPGARRVD